MPSPIITGFMPSSVIRHFEYDAGARRLDVQFVSEKRYSYFDVPEEVVAEMRRASSKGGFFNQHIRDHYRFKRASSVTRQ